MDRGDRARVAAGAGRGRRAPSWSASRRSARCRSRRRRRGGRRRARPPSRRASATPSSGPLAIWRRRRDRRPTRDAIRTALGGDPARLRDALPDPRGPGRARAAARAERRTPSASTSSRSRPTSTGAGSARGLARAGLLGAPVVPGARRPLRIAFEGVDSYPLWERIERALGSRGGAGAAARVHARPDPRRARDRGSDRRRGRPPRDGARGGHRGALRSGWTARRCWWRSRRWRRRPADPPADPAAPASDTRSRALRSLTKASQIGIDCATLAGFLARSSVGEHYLDTVGVGGSIPPVPTILGRSVPATTRSGISREFCPCSCAPHERDPRAPAGWQVARRARGHDGSRRSGAHRPGARARCARRSRRRRAGRPAPAARPRTLPSRSSPAAIRRAAR